MQDRRKELDDLLTSQGIPTDSETKVDVVYGGAFSIKDYYMESGNPRQMRGASQLLLDAADKFAAQRFFACGAESFLIVREEDGKTVAREVEEAFREATLTAQAAAVCRTTTVGKLLDAAAFKELWQGLNKDFAKRRMLLFPPMDKQSGAKPCKYCNFRDAIENDMCRSCAKKEKRGTYHQDGTGDGANADGSADKKGKSAKKLREGYRDKCLAFGERELGITLRDKDKDKEVKTTQDIADGNGDIALLYGDINNLGGEGKRLVGDVIERKRFTEAVERTVRDSLHAAVIKAVDISESKAFEVIAVGGDDICVLLPGEVALYAGKELLEQFDARWKERPADLPPLTISASIAVGQANTPLLYMRETAEQLLKIAKKKAYKQNCSCLDILSLNNDGQWATNIEKKLRKDLKKSEGGVQAIRTMRPFTVGEAARLLDNLEAHDVTKSTLYNIAEASEHCGIVEGDLWFRYLLARQTDGKLKGLAAAYGDGMYYNVPGRADGITKVSPWHDIAELKGQKGGGRR